MTASRAFALQERSWTLHAEGRLVEAAACRAAIALVDDGEAGAALDRTNLLNDLAEIERDRGHLDTALAIVARARLVALPDDGPAEDTARIWMRTLTLSGALRRTLGLELDEAWAELREAEAIAIATFGEPSEETAVVCNELGLLCKARGHLDAGGQFYERALTTMVAIHDDNSPAAGAILHNIGGLWHERGDHAAAEAPSRRAWEISRRHLGAEHPQTMADAVAYAAVLHGLGRHEECERLCRDALAVFERIYGADHDEVAAVLHNLGAAMESRGDTCEAERCCRRALAIREQRRGPDSFEAALARNNLGKLLTETGRAAEGLPLLQRSLAVLESRLPAAHPHLARVSANLRAAHAATSPAERSAIESS